MKQIGTPIRKSAELKVITEGPGIGWKLSEETLEELRLIDENAKMAMQRARNFRAN